MLSMTAQQKIEAVMGAGQRTIAAHGWAIEREKPVSARPGLEFVICQIPTWPSPHTQQIGGTPMPQPDYNVHATALTAYAIAWGFLCKLGEKGVLAPQEIMDALDFALTFIEENAKQFDDQTATDTARQLLESLMKIVGEGKMPKRSSSSDNWQPRHSAMGERH
jgi:hypothetical protein